jgi:hypothetical protein
MSFLTVMVVWVRYFGYICSVNQLKKKHIPMKNLILFLFCCVTFMSCKKEATKPDVFAVEQSILQKAKDLDEAVPDSVIALYDEPVFLTDDQIRELAMSQPYWREDFLKTVLSGDRSYMERYGMLKSAMNRSSSEPKLETFVKRTNGYIVDSSPDHLAQVVAALGSTVGQQSSLNVFRPINDNGVVTFTDAMFASSRSTFQTADNLIEVDTIGFEFPVSGGNWLVSARITYRVGTIFQTEEYCFDCPNGSLVWNPTLGSGIGVEDDVIVGPMPFNTVSISSNGQVPLVN